MMPSRRSLALSDARRYLALGVTMKVTLIVSSAIFTAGLVGAPVAPFTAFWFTGKL